MIKSKKKTNSILYRSLFVLFVLCSMTLYAQDQKQQERKTRVDLLHADKGKVDKKTRPDVQLLLGNVKLRHDSMYMYCDSALIYEKTNSVEAFSNVRMEQGDTLFIYGDYLFYDGMSQIAQLRSNVKLINRNTTLITDSLNYDRLYNLGYYFEGGILSDEENVLTSDWGEYSPSTKLAVFNHEVTLDNPRFMLTSDTLKYHTETKLATILGPSDIYNQDNHIYSERGFYNTLDDQAELMDRSVLTSGGRQLTGDSLYYDRRMGYGEAFYDVEMNDTINKNMLMGDYCYYNEHTEFAYATGKAVVVDYSQQDSLFIHGDTLKMNTYHLNTDSVYRDVMAYHKVRMYRNDLQGVADSLTYNSKDSCITMYYDPILWTGEQQLLGEEIKAYIKDNKIDWAHIINQTLVVEQKDTIHYNQISGKEIKAFFEDNQLHEVNIIGNVLVVFYPQEEDSTMIGMNTSETSQLNLFFKEQKVERMIMSPKSNGVLYPMDQIPEDKLRLANFQWFDYIRPKSREDIFEWRPKAEEAKLKKSDREPIDISKRTQIQRR